MDFHRQRWLKRAVSVIIGLAVVGGMGWLVVQKVTHSEPAPSPSSSPQSELPAIPATPSATPSYTLGKDVSEEQDASQSGFKSCEEALSAASYQALMSRAEAYEPVWLSVDSPEKQTAMDQFGTARYLKANKVFVDPRLEVKGAAFELDLARSSFSCSQNLDGSIRVALIPVVRPYILSGNQKEYVSDWTTFPLHTSDWKQVANTWKIDAER